MCRVVVWTQTDDAFLAEAADKGVYAGSTASTLLVLQCRKFGPITLMCGNVGDSRCVLSREGTAFDMSVDHKPGNSDESKPPSGAHAAHAPRASSKAAFS